MNDQPVASSRLVKAAVLALSLLAFTVPALGLLGFVPLEDRVADADFIVVGRLIEIERFAVSVQSTDPKKPEERVDTVARYFLDRGHIDVQAVLKVGRRLPTEHNVKWTAEHGASLVFPSPLIRDSLFTTSNGDFVMRRLTAEDFSPSLDREGIWLLRWAPFVQAYSIRYEHDLVPLDSLEAVTSYVSRSVEEHEEILRGRVERRLQGRAEFDGERGESQ